MPTDSVLSWGILLLVSACGFCCFVAAVIRADENRYKESDGGSDAW